MKNQPDYPPRENCGASRTGQSTRDVVEDAIELSKDPDASWNDKSDGEDLRRDPDTVGVGSDDRW